MYTFIKKKPSLNVIKNLFGTDCELLSSFHIEAGKGLEACSKRTFNDLLSFPNLEFYYIFKEEKLIGFFGRQKFDVRDCLTSFFLDPDYRKDNVEIFNKILSTFEKNIVTSGLYTKNKRAIKFLSKLGFIISYEDNDKTIMTLLREK